MTQLRRDAAYIRTKAPKGSKRADALTSFDEEVCNVLTSAHTVTSAAKTLAQGRTADTTHTDLESDVAASMLRLLEAERIELSPDS
jgi:hypothetical protein